MKVLLFFCMFYVNIQELCAEFACAVEADAVMEEEEVVGPAPPAASGGVAPYYGVSSQTSAADLRVLLAEQKRNNSKCMQSGAALRMTKGEEWVRRVDARIRAANKELKAAKSEHKQALCEIKFAKDDFDWASGLVDKYDSELMVECARAEIAGARAEGGSDGDM